MPRKLPTRKARPTLPATSHDVPDEDTPIGSPSLDAIAGKAERYDDLRKNEKKVKGQKDDLGKELKELALKLGVKEAKSHILEVPGFKIQHCGTTRNVVNQEEAAAVLRGLGLLERCSKTVLDEEALEQAFQEGLITIDEIESFTEEKVSYRLDLRRT